MKGAVRINGRTCCNRSWRVRSGQRVEIRLAGGNDAQAKSRERVPRLEIRYADAEVVVVEKPAGLTTMRHGKEAAEFGARAKRFLPSTLADLLPPALARQGSRGPSAVYAVHRIDKDTSGLVVFARTREAVRSLGKQFREHAIERTYVAVVRGRAAEGRIESWLVRDRGDGRRGSSNASREGKRAVTHMRVLERLSDYTLVECRLETGRTHQVRIHLAEAGTPLCGERIYDRPLHGRQAADGSGATRIALHAATLGINHPKTGKRLRWSSPLPPDMARLVGRLRERAKAAERAAATTRRRHDD
jgi:23S rRNA pseudouridine1911/1915/1917 synthase